MGHRTGGSLEVTLQKNVEAELVDDVGVDGVLVVRNAAALRAEQVRRHQVRHYAAGRAELRAGRGLAKESAVELVRSSEGVPATPRVHSAKQTRSTFGGWHTTTVYSLIVVLAMVAAAASTVYSMMHFNKQSFQHPRHGVYASKRSPVVSC